MADAPLSNLTPASPVHSARPPADAPARRGGGDTRPAPCSLPRLSEAGHRSGAVGAGAFSVRFSCSCPESVTVGSHANSVSVGLPPHMSEYRDARVAAILSPQISVDRCILPLIRHLWALGITTHASCCGHRGQAPANVVVAEQDKHRMREMGFSEWTTETGVTCFCLEVRPSTVKAFRKAEQQMKRFARKVNRTREVRR